jgi:predicted nucleic acid-binding protein
VRYVLDTNIVSESVRRRPDPVAMAWYASAEQHELCTSTLVVGEIRKGVEALRPRAPERALAFERWLAALVERFDSRVIPITVPIAETWGRLAAIRPLPTVDGLLIATAAVHGLTFVSREADRYADLGVSVLNPWVTSA